MVQVDLSCLTVGRLVGLGGFKIVLEDSKRGHAPVNSSCQVSAYVTCVPQPVWVTRLRANFDSEDPLLQGVAVTDCGRILQFTAEELVDIKVFVNGKIIHKMI